MHFRSRCRRKRRKTNGKDENDAAADGGRRAEIHLRDRPNILLIMSDQHRGDTLGCAGHPCVRTPHLDRLAGQGAFFRNAFSPMPVCVPARYSVITGCVPLAWGSRSNGGIIPAHVPTLPAILRGHGYRSALMGKAHYTAPPEECRRTGIPGFRWNYGFDEVLFAEEGRQWRDGDDYEAYLKGVGWHGWQRAHGIGNNDVRTSPSPLPLEHYQTVWATDESIRWLQRHGRTEPFFLMTSYVKPHAPYDPPEPYDKMYNPLHVPAPIGGPVDLKDLSPAYELERRAYGWHTLPDEAHLRARAFYYGNVTLIDDQVGRLLATLDELGLADDTIVAFVSDHGDLLGDHGLYFKGLFFRESWHIPLIVKAPGNPVRSGGLNRLVSLQDLMPTLLSLAGMPIPRGVHGQDLTGDPEQGPDIIFGSYASHSHGLHCARTARWQYVFHEAGGFEELYDIVADPDERHNRIGLVESREVSRDLRRRTAAWLGRLGDRESLDASGDLKAGPVPQIIDPPMTKLPLGLRPY
jgi:arylsulfatase